MRDITVKKFLTHEESIVAFLWYEEEQSPLEQGS